MNVLITGGAGFIGSHLADRFVRTGCRVSILDNLTTGSLKNLAGILSSHRLSFRKESVLNAAAVEDLVDSADLVVHLAAAVGVRLVVENPVRTIETNVHGTEVILRAAAKRRRRVILASTSEVYGLNTEIPFRETANSVLGATTHRRWGYACSKALDEFLGLAYWREKRVPVTIVRLFNTIGPRQTWKYGMVVPTFVRQALRGRPITVHGNGRQSRCFAFVDDVVEALVRIAACDAAAGEVINVGSEKEISMTDLAELVRDAAESNSEIRHIPYEVAWVPGFDDMPSRVPCL